MKILLPPHKLKSAEVLELSEDLKADIAGMKLIMEKQNFFNNRTGLALAHCQVSRNPYKIFVTNSNRVFINAEILEGDDSFIAEEMCLSFPFRPKIKVKRYSVIKAKYQDENMKWHEEQIAGLLAQVFQHEDQHFRGENIYGK